MADEIVCKICSQKSTYIFSAKILQKYDIKYFHCPNCGFLQTEEPFWLDEAYSSAIGIVDTGILQRNLLLSKRTSVLINFCFNKKNKFLDYAAGYGIFVRLMRDIGYDFYWSDPYADNLLARGFEYDDLKKIELVTAFECFEHFANPIEEIEKILDISETVIFSTRVFKNTPPKPEDWWYYSLKTGQHISLYSVKTLKFIAAKYKLYLSTDNKSFHLFSKKKINNTIFNLLNKLSIVGLSRFVQMGMPSKTDSDFDLLTKKIGN